MLSICCRYAVDMLSICCPGCTTSTLCIASAASPRCTTNQHHSTTAPLAPLAPRTLSTLCQHWLTLCGS
ncbi:hypothetical protein BC831DRAFT_444177 [Entophlyctis helioformis]|nr:hypothetical protein BC831DRAFT_444177 [Entophlyctis helioformis]